MIEIITTAALLVSSFYGPAAADASTSAVDLSNSTIASTATSTIITSAPIASTTETAGTIASTSDSVKNVKSFVKAYYADEPLLVDIASCESDFRQYDADGNILRGRVNHDDVGVMQINEKYHLEKARSMGYDITTTKGNVEYAKYLYDTEGAAPWKASEPCWDKLAMK